MELPCWREENLFSFYSLSAVSFLPAVRLSPPFFLSCLTPRRAHAEIGCPFLWQGFYLGIPVTALIQPPTQWSGYKTLWSSYGTTCWAKLTQTKGYLNTGAKKHLNIWTTAICPTLLFHLRFLYKTEDPLSPRNIWYLSHLWHSLAPENTSVKCSC